MSQLNDKLKEIKETGVRLLSGVLSNPNYNFSDAKKAASTAIEHAREFVVKFAELVEKEADKVGDKARGTDDDIPVVPEAPKDPLSEI